ncbi:MAG TPA: universal stress protein [Actinomycetota bacterium]
MSARLVVGVDGSQTATLAVRWAAREATLRGASLELVSAWEIPVTGVGFGYGFAPIPDEMIKGLEQGAEELLAEAAEAARTEAPEIQIETRVVEGPAASALLEASKDADMLVVGSRGMGGFRELLLGSVSAQCAHHASCPVVIVRHERAA